MDVPEEQGEPEATAPQVPDRGEARDPRTGRSAPAERIRQQTQWVDLQVREAMARGEFDDLPGQGKPIEGLGTEHDPDWWLKKLVEREQLSVLPPALAIRKEDAELDGVLDRLAGEAQVRREVEDFNARVRRALYTPPTGNAPAPPVVTRQRDPDAEVTRWRERRDERVRAQRAALEAREARERAERASRPRRRWWPFGR
jgi:hypothetical protein